MGLWQIITIIAGGLWLLGGVIGLISAYKKATYPYWHPTYYCADCHKTKCEVNCKYYKEAEKKGELYPYR